MPIHDKIALMAQTYTTDELTAALHCRLKHLSDNYKKIPNDRYMQFHYEVPAETLAWLGGDNVVVPFRQEVFLRFNRYLASSDLADVVYDQEIEHPIGVDGVMKVRRGTITYIRPDRSAQWGGV